MNSKKTSPIWTVPTENLVEVVKLSTSLAEVMRRLGYSVTTGITYKTLKHRLNNSGIDYSHIQLGLNNNREKPSSNRLTLEFALGVVFIKDSIYINAKVKTLLRRFNLKPETCSICGLKPEWQGKPLSLELDHINGIRNDHRLENLRLLCPNCHSQTETFSVRNSARFKMNQHTWEKNKELNKQKRIEHAGFYRSAWPDKETLIALVSLSSLRSIGKKFGVSDNAVRKWCRAYGIDTKAISPFAHHYRAPSASRSGSAPLTGETSVQIG